MHTSQRIAAATLLAVAVPAAAHQQEPAPPAEQPAEQPVETQWPPASTHGAVVPVPDEEQQAYAVPARGSEITENTTEYVFDLCDLLDQAAAEEATPAP